MKREKLSKALWGILLILVAVLALWWGAIATKHLLTYWRLAEEVPAKLQSFEVIPKRSKYALLATFSYNHSGKTFTSKTLFKKPYHLNRPSVEREIEKIQGMQWSAWVDSKHPEISSLEKDFPFRECLYAGCLLCIFIYFVYLRIHLQLLSRAL